MDELIMKTNEFININKECDKDTLISKWNNIRMLYNSLEDKKGYTLKYGMYYEMMNTFIDKLESNYNISKVSSYKQIMDTIAIMNDHFQNLTNGSLNLDANKEIVSNISQTLNDIMVKVNSFYQKLFNLVSTEALSNKSLPTFKPYSGNKEEYLQYVKDEICKMFSIKEDVDLSLDDFFAEPVTLGSFSKSDNGLSELKPFEEESDNGLSSSLDDIVFGKEAPSETKVFEAPSKDNITSIEAKLQELETKSKKLESRKETTVVSKEQSIVLARRKNYDIYNKTLTFLINDYEKKINVIMEKINNRQYLLDDEGKKYNEYLDILSLLKNEKNRVERINAKELENINLDLQIPNYDINPYEIVDYLQNGKKFPYNDVKPKLIEPPKEKVIVNETVKPQILPIPKNIWIPKIGDFVKIVRDNPYNNEINDNIVPLFASETNGIYVNQIVFKNDNLLYRAFDNEKVDEYQNLGYEAVAVSENNEDFYSINDIAELEIRKVA